MNAKRNPKEVSIFVIVLILLVCVTTFVQAADYNQDQGTAKNVIFMVPDGMGLSNVTAARIFINGIAGAPLSLERLEHIGYQRTYSRNQTITDSAPAASAWACGQKFNDGEICFHVEGEENPPSILELAGKEGKATGLVATSTITHATPAAFGSHVKSRNCEYEIGRQYVMETQPHVLLGGGMEKFAESAHSSSCSAINSGDLTEKALKNGYTLVKTKSEMEAALSKGAGKLLGLFNTEGMTPECKRKDTPYGDPLSPESLKCTDTPVETTEPRLVEMTRAALDILEKDKNGFFLMVEGSQIDWANHANQFEYQLGEMLAFDDAVKTILEWINKKPERKSSTLVVIVADHDCGGFAVNGPYGAGKLVKKGKIEPGWTSIQHTGVDTIIWSQGPGSKRLAKGALENTYLYQVMKDAMRIE